MSDHPQRMQSLELIARSLTDVPTVANQLAFDLTELEDACTDVSAQIQHLRNMGVQGKAATRHDLIAFLSHLMHWRGHERAIRKVVDRAVDRLPNPEDAEGEAK